MHRSIRIGEDLVTLNESTRDPSENWQQLDYLSRPGRLYGRLLKSSGSSSPTAIIVVWPTTVSPSSRLIVSSDELRRFVGGWDGAQAFLIAAVTSLRACTGEPLNAYRASTMHLSKHHSQSGWPALGWSPTRNLGRDRVASTVLA
jgi:hypothetical protein